MSEYRRKEYIERLYLYTRIDYLLREEGRRRVRVEVPREEALDQLGLQATQQYNSPCLSTFLLGSVLLFGLQVNRQLTVGSLLICILAFLGYALSVARPAAAR